MLSLAVPVVDTSTEEPPPLLIAVHGPPGVGKTTLIRCLIKHFTRQSAGELRGPVTVVSSKKRRLTFVECPNDICGMIDVAKAADLVLLLVDGEFGFEMETFEFLMLLQQHGMPKVIGVLNHLDGFKDNKKLKKVKKELKTRFSVEVSHGSKLFYLSGIRHGKYLKREVLNLARFISTAKTRPINWRLSHPYLLTDRFEVRRFLLCSALQRLSFDPGMLFIHVCHDVRTEKECIHLPLYFMLEAKLRLCRLSQARRLFARTHGVNAQSLCLDTFVVATCESGSVYTSLVWMTSPSMRLSSFLTLARCLRRSRSVA